MAVYKCKMCGGELHVEEGMKVVECEYCGSSQTVASSNDDKILKLYARGNLLRTQNDFDKAYNIFEQIVVENPKDAEGFWNLLLCKYGITYVDDYDGSKKPTINRMSMVSIKDDQDYLKVLENADIVSKTIYEHQASQIAKIQEDILKIVKSEQPYDIFISYKETDEFGDRTEDSVLAQEIYDTLTKEGYKVFLSRVTLANAIGSEYEPYIYSALYSSKVMILVTTKEEYVNAVWVKNEWSRFLKMMKDDSSKKIIPCFKYVDPYDLPKEIRNIQSINFDKLGAIQDLVIGVNKILGKSRKNVNETASTSTGTQIDSLLKRVSMFLDDKEWEKANEYCEKVLDIDPENAQAYLYKFLINCEVSNLDELSSEISIYTIYENVNFKKALRFADEKLKNELTEHQTNETARLRKLATISTREELISTNLKAIIVDEYFFDDYEGDDFDGCISIEKVEILEGVTSIGVGAFSGCSNLTSVSIPNSVTIIESYAFADCARLISISIPNSVTSIEDGAFARCSNLTSINIPNSVTKIESFTFEDCSSLTTVTFEKNSRLTKIDEFAFYNCSNLTSIELPNSVISIEPTAFSGCPCENQIHNKMTTTSSSTSKPTSITISSSETNIVQGLYEGCLELTTIEIPEGTTSIGPRAFAKCSNLTTVVIPEGLISIGQEAFQGCSNLINVTIPSSVTSIGAYAFGGCEKLASIIVPKNVTSIEEGAFGACSNLMNVTIPSSVTSIGAYAFLGCGKLKSITIPSSVTNIGEHAFADCSNLTNIKILSSVVNIHKDAFFKCPCEEQVRNRTTSTTSRSTTRPTTSTTQGTKTGGCYVATCVYGSYDCPEVWTLRRFRDDTLGSTWYGRMFIRVYYAISPKLVKWFGDKKWFKKFSKNTLDRMIYNLQSKGVESSPYDDKKW